MLISVKGPEHLGAFLFQDSGFYVFIEYPK